LVELVVLTGFAQVLLGNTVVYQIEHVHSLVVICVVTYEYIIRLDITMNKSLIMKVLQEIKHLIANGHDALGTKVLLASFQDVF
jgi:hypothetical protein